MKLPGTNATGSFIGKVGQVEEKLKTFSIIMIDNPALSRNK